MLGDIDAGLAQADDYRRGDFHTGWCIRATWSRTPATAV